MARHGPDCGAWEDRDLGAASGTIPTLNLYVSEETAIDPSDRQDAWDAAQVSQANLEFWIATKGGDRATWWSTRTTAQKRALWLEIRACKPIAW